MEYHAFGIVSYVSFLDQRRISDTPCTYPFRREGTHAKYHYLICGVKGDFTRRIVQDPPTHLWTRQLKVRF